MFYRYINLSLQGSKIFIDALQVKQKMGKYFNRGTLDAECFGKLFQYKDAQLKSGGKFYSPENLIEKFYAQISTAKYITEQQKAWFADAGNRQKLQQWAADYQQEKPELFGRNTPLEKRLQFGIYREHEYDINFGLKETGEGYGFISDEKFAALLNKYDPWSIKHVNKELGTKHSIDLKSVLEQLAEPGIEQKLAEHWLENYYSDDKNPALIPQLYGTGKKFWVKKENGLYKIGDVDFDCDPDFTVVRFDFAVINYRKQKKVLIELDGQESHKTHAQRSKDAVKRNLAGKHGWEFKVYTGGQITHEFDAVIEDLKDFFLPN